MKAYKFKLKLNQHFQAGCERTLELCRELYNAGLQERRDAWEMCGESANFATQCAQLPDIKELRPELKDVHSQVLQATLKKLHRAFENFFRRVKRGEEPGYPRFKSRDRFDSFCYPQAGFRLEGNKLHLSKIGSCRLRLSRKIEGTIKTCTIKREASGWFAIFAVEENQCRFLSRTGKKVGIDVGLNSFATLSTGEQIENPRWFRQSEERLAAAQRRLQTKKRGSNKRKAARRRVSKVHEKIRNQRQDFFHKLSNDLLSRFDELHIENLNIRGMLKNGHLAKSISDAAWGAFFNIISSKAEGAGRKVVEKVAAYTSQTCFDCGHRQKLKLSDRVFHCQNCGALKDRDHNASLNILGSDGASAIAGIPLL
jgi:putative transposase